MEINTSEKWYKVRELFDNFGVGRSVIRNAINRGYLVASKIPKNNKDGFVYYISESNFKDWKSDPFKVRNENADIKKTRDARAREHQNRKERLRKEREEKFAEMKREYLDPNEKWMTPQEAANELGVHVSCIYVHIKEGKMKAVKLPKGRGGIYISESSLIEYLEAKRQYSKKEEPIAEPRKETATNPSNTYSVNEENITVKISNMVKYLIEDETRKAYSKGFEEGYAKAEKDTIAKMEDMISKIKGVA